MKITADKAKAFAILAGVAAAGFVAYKIYSGTKKTLTAAADVVTHDLNPASDQNIVYRGLNTLTGGDNADSSLGTRIYDFFH